MDKVKISLTQFLQEKDDFLKGEWQSSVNALTSRIGQFHLNSEVFQEIKKLMMNLVSLVERTGSAEQAVDAEIKPIISLLKKLQTENKLNTTEMVFFIFLMRDILKDIIKELLGENPEGKEESPYFETLDQVSSLLNRLGLVLFENAMRLRKEDGMNQDVLAIEYALLYERTRQLAITDKLTGLYNFGYFHERLKEERLRAERYHRLLSLVLFDIDNFKKYNDANGHPAGNEVLKKIAEILKTEAREVDIVARYGGEEMVIILPETSRKWASELAERIRLKISETSFDRMKKQPLGRITVSAGVATYPVDAGTEDELIQKADNSMYRAKSQGRNRVVSYEPAVKVTLRYKTHHALSKVALVGNFNNWDKEADPMVKQADGAYQLTVALNPGVYHYKFVLNDVEWIPDPACPERDHDTLGGDNSVLRVSA